MLKLLYFVHWYNTRVKQKIVEQQKRMLTLHISTFVITSLQLAHILYNKFSSMGISHFSSVLSYYPKLQKQRFWSSCFYKFIRKMLFWACEICFRITNISNKLSSFKRGKLNNDNKRLSRISWAFMVFYKHNVSTAS